MARQQRSLQKLAAYRAGTLGTASQTGSMRSHGRGGLGSLGHSTLLVTTVADADESEQLQQLHTAHGPTGAPTNEPLPAVAVTATSSSSSSRAATPPETSALPDVDDEGVLVFFNSCALPRVLRNFELLLRDYENDESSRASTEPTLIRQSMTISG